MPLSLPDLFRDWHDFYGLAGTAAATLIGLMFVAASIGANMFSEADKGPLRAFVTPTLVHFAAVLFTALIVTIPAGRWNVMNGLILAGGLAGSVYSGRVFFEVGVVRRSSVDLGDRMFYALIPLVGYLLLAVAGALMAAQPLASADVLAVSMLALLLAESATPGT